MEDQEASKASSSGDRQTGKDLLPGIRIKGDGEAAQSSPNPSIPGSPSQPALFSHPSPTSSVSSSSSTSSTRPSHSRSRSVNLSPTLHAGTSFSPGAIRWDPYGADSALRNAVTAHQSSTGNAGHASSSNIPSANQLHPIQNPHQHMSSFSPSNFSNPASSPKLRPTSPIYVNVHAPSPTGSSAPVDIAGRSPLYNVATSEGGSSNGSSGSLNSDHAISTSPETRRPSHLIARAMEKSSSAGSSGFSPRSPRSPHRSDYSRRTQSPSRAYAIPMSPRLQALGSSGHVRRLSGNGTEPIARIPSPSFVSSQLGRSPSRGESGLHIAMGGNEAGSPSSPRINPDPELPVDSVWPSTQHHEQALPVTASGLEAIPLDAGSTYSTPIPPSLRDEVAAHSSAGGMTAIPIPVPSSPGRRSPLVDWHAGVRMQRTPSPLNWGTTGSHQPTGRRGSHSSSSNVSAHYSSSPLRSSSPRLAAPQPIASNSLNLANAAMHRHSRALSNSSVSSNDSDVDARDMAIPQQRSHDEQSPTHKAVSQPRTTSAKVDAQIVHAEVGASADHNDEADQRESIGIANQQNNLDRRNMIIPPPRHSSSPQERIRFLERRSSFELHSPSFASRTLLPPREEYSYLNGIPIRAQSPAHMASSPSGSASSTASESPPKVRSFIGMPPRSGYELSDDPDDVGSEDGSVGSGRDSVGTNEDRDEEEEDEGEDEKDGKQDADLEGAVGEMDEDSFPQSQTQAHGSAPKRPPLSPGTVVVPDPMTVQPANAVTRYWGEHGDQESQQSVPTDIDIEAGEEDDQQDDNFDQVDENDPLQEEGLTTLERIFLFAKSEMTYHRILVSHSLADWILEVELNEAVEFVIPLLNGLACDVNEVCSSFAPQLHRLMWYFFRNCPLAEDTKNTIEPASTDADGFPVENDERATRPRLSISTFTPLLCALLLNSNATIANSTQTAIVFFCARLQGFGLAGDTFELDEEDTRVQQPHIGADPSVQSRQPFDANTTLVRDAAAREDKRILLEDYEFGAEQREMIMNELLEQVAVAIGHLSSDKSERATGSVNHDQPNEAVYHDGEDHAASAQSIKEEHSDQQMDHVDGASGENQAVTNTATDTGAENVESKPRELAQEAQDDQRETEMEHDSDTLEPKFDEQQDFSQNQADEEMMTWASSDDIEDGLGDTAMASVDGASITMSIEEEVAVGRMASISLLAAIGTENLIGKDFMINRVIPELIASAGDRTFFVRKEAAVAVGILARAIGHDHIREQNILGVFSQLCQDTIWHVRQAACLSAPNLFAQVVDRFERRKELMEVMSGFVNDVSRNVRVAALDIIGEVIYLFHDDPEGVPEHLVRHFLGQPWDGKDENVAEATHSNTASKDIGNDQQNDRLAGTISEDIEIDSTNVNTWTHSSDSSDSMSSGAWRYNDAFGGAQPGELSFDGLNSDPDRPLVMAYNLPAVALTLGADKWHVLREVHSQLSNHASSKVRRSLAASLHEIAKIVGLDAASKDLLPFVSHFLDPKFEQDGEVKMALLENIDVTLCHMHVESGLEAMKVIQDLWNDTEIFGTGARFPNHWRMREKVISKIPALASKFLLEDDQGILVMLMQSALMDSVSAVRMKGVSTVSGLYHLFAEQDQVLADGFLGMLVDVSDSDDAGYRARVATLQSIAQLCQSQIQRSSIEMLAMPRLLELSKDEIVDVRLALASLIQLMCSSDQLYALPQSRSDRLIRILRRLGNDESGLVRETIESVVGSDYITELGPVSPLEPRPARELILGPIEGGPHKPLSSFMDGMNMTPHESRGDDFDTGEQTFSMDDDEDERDEDEMQEGAEESQGDGQDNSRPGALNRNDIADADGKGERRPAPSLANSTLARRRIANQIHPSMNGTNGWNNAGNNHGHGMSMSDEGDEDMIVIPSDENALLLSAHLPSDHLSGPLTSAILDEDDGEDESPHHLLSVADKSTPVKQGNNTYGSLKRLDALRTQDDLTSNDPSFSLESPERAFHHAKEASNNSTGEDPTTGSTKDPFLAFVAGQHFVDHQNTNGTPAETKAVHRRSTPDVPLSPSQQRSAFDDDDDDEYVEEDEEEE
ncbi:ARM repeat-containing protein [Meira miltonrushii]|uniref:ARM repeat-containing protein n=1 Tax=Meira miltonrushii TaxID=1280837 RepID=A0A316VJI7_9BASI|nr:ARM repeat-containing protein [Meira miltonrushii]PWN36191.1 ARM repeat-containing protein [Meira miltonrushii]